MTDAEKRAVLTIARLEAERDEAVRIATRAVAAMNEMHRDYTRYSKELEAATDQLVDDFTALSNLVA